MQHNRSLYGLLFNRLISACYEPIDVNVLEYATTVIHQLISEGYYVYLHCSASRGRSPTIAAAYIIRFLGKDKEEAMNQVKNVRLNAWTGEDGKIRCILRRF